MATPTLPDGRVVAVTGSGDRTVRVWDLATGTAIGDPLTGHTNWVVAVATTTVPDGRVVAVTGSTDDTVRIWDLATGAQLGVPLPTPHTVYALAAARLGGEPAVVVCCESILAVAVIRAVRRPA